MSVATSACGCVEPRVDIATGALPVGPFPQSCLEVNGFFWAVFVGDLAHFVWRRLLRAGTLVTARRRSQSQAHGPRLIEPYRAVKTNARRRERVPWGEA